MSEIDVLNLRAKQILNENDKGSYTIPNESLYPFQWNWDSAFAAFGFAQFDISRSWKEIETLLSGQWENGMVPHILYHQVDENYFPGPNIWMGTGPLPSSGISQPPVAATLVRKIWEKDPNNGYLSVSNLYPKLLKWHRWFMNWRSDDGLIYVTHPWESGRDNAPDWDIAMNAIQPTGLRPYVRRDTFHLDPVMRPTKYDYDRYIWLVDQGRKCNWDESWLKKNGTFQVADPAMNFILLRANRDLRHLAVYLGEDIDELDSWISYQEKGVRKLWNSEILSYDSYDLKSGKYAGSISNASFMCWYGGVYDKRMLAHYDRIMKQVHYGMPSHDPESKKFDRKRYWRGPSWAIANMLIGVGLEDAGEERRATLIREQTRLVISKNGFAEYFDPIDGSPAGGNSFTWTAAVWLGWAKNSGGLKNGHD